MRVASFLLCCLLVSCSMPQTPSMPELRPVSIVDAKADICKYAFVTGDWQFVHSINFAMSNGYGATLVGITVLQGKKLKTVLMGVEGFVLFEAEQEEPGQIVVHRAMPPFDKAGFAEGLMRDVQTLFREPEFLGKVLAENTSGESVCRYTTASNRVTDVVTAEQGWNRITLYDNEGVVQQSITAPTYREVAGESVPERIHLKSLGVQGYSLQLQLLRADKL
jgi:hypothetical protein